MKTSRTSLLNRTIVVLMVTILLLIPASAASANVRVPGGATLPYYARITSYYDYPVEWVAIVFYRPPACVPDNFDLYTEFFDIPGAFACEPATTTGFEVWKLGPGLEDSPKLVELKGLGAVPMWFVSWSAFQAAAADQILSKADLEAMHPLKGTASFYHETMPLKGMTTAVVGEYNARGKLEDGRTFIFHATDVGVSMKSYSVIFK
jgi:hypothetical protein